MQIFISNYCSILITELNEIKIKNQADPNSDMFCSPTNNNWYHYISFSYEQHALRGAGFTGHDYQII